MKIKTILITAVLVVGAGVATSFIIRRTNESNIKQVEVVPVASINSAAYSYGDSGTISGSVISKDTQVVSLDTSHELVDVYVQEGDRVKKGDKLLEYDMLGDELKEEMEELTKMGLELSLEGMKRDLATLRSGRLPESMGGGSGNENSDEFSAEEEDDDEDDEDAGPSANTDSDGRSTGQQVVRQGGQAVGAADILSDLVGVVSDDQAESSVDSLPEEFLQILRQKRENQSVQSDDSDVVVSSSYDDEYQSMLEDLADAILSGEYGLYLSEDGNYIVDVDGKPVNLEDALSMLFGESGILTGDKLVVDMSKTTGPVIDDAIKTEDDTGNDVDLFEDPDKKTVEAKDDEKEKTPPDAIDEENNNREEEPALVLDIANKEEEKKEEEVPAIEPQGALNENDSGVDPEGGNGNGLISGQVFEGEEPGLDSGAGEEGEGTGDGADPAAAFEDEENGNPTQPPAIEEEANLPALTSEIGSGTNETAPIKAADDTIIEETGSENDQPVDGGNQPADEGGQTGTGESNGEGYSEETVFEVDDAELETNFTGDVMIYDETEGPDEVEEISIVSDVNTFLSEVNAITLAVGEDWSLIGEQMPAIDAALEKFRTMFAEADQQETIDLFGENVVVTVYTVSPEVINQIGNATAKVMQTAYDRLCALHFINSVLNLNIERVSSPELSATWPVENEQALRAVVTELASLPSSMWIYNPVTQANEFSSEYGAMNAGIFNGQSILDFLRGSVQVVNSNYVMEERADVPAEISTEGKLYTPRSSDSDYDDGYGYSAEELAEMIREQEKNIKETELQIREAELGIKEYKKILDGKIVYATMDGIVKNAGSSDSSSRSAFITITGKEGLYVKGSINELALDTVKVGDIITGTSYETGSTFTAEIVEISEYPDESSNSYYGFGDENTNSSYYPFLAYIENAEGLSVDSYVELSLSNTGTQSSDGFSSGGGLALEEYYIRTDNNGRSYCYVRGKDGLLEKRYLELGANNWGVINIKSGLTQSDCIAFPYGDGVEEGAQTVKVDSLAAVDGEVY